MGKIRKSNSSAFKAKEIKPLEYGKLLNCRQKLFFTFFQDLGW